MNSSQPTASKNTPSTVDIAAYADALAAVISTAGVLDPVHLRALYRVFAALQAPPAIRRAALWRAFETHADVESLPVPSDREAQQALAADALRVVPSQPGSPIPETIAPLLRKLNVDPAQIDFLRSWIDWENRILHCVGKGDSAVPEAEYPVELVKRAAALGIPLSVLYFSGSVIGFSAVGITSGLAAIGSASGLVLLGLNPMTAGIAALIIGGITIKKILDALSSPSRELQKREELEAQVQELARLRQAALDYLTADEAALQRGAWWEIFTGWRPLRRSVVAALREVRNSEQAAHLPVIR